MSRIRHETDKGVFVKPSDITVNDYLDEYFVGATRGRRQSTKVSYRDAFRPARERLGNRKLQSITKADIENLVDWMLTSGRKRGGKPGTGLGTRSVRLTLGRLKAAFEMAVDEGKLVRNVVKLVTPPEYTPKERGTRSKTQVRKFLRTAAATRLHAAWRLSLYGLRRGEVLGLRWSDVDLKAKTLTVNQARVLVDYRVRIEEPKSRNGKRTLPLDDDLVAALTDLRKRQAKESEQGRIRVSCGPRGPGLACRWGRVRRHRRTRHPTPPRVVLGRVHAHAQARGPAQDPATRLTPHHL